MANKRMFNIKIVDSDAFLDMPLSTQALYFHLNMRADDDGFIGKPKRIQRLIGCSEDDLKLLLAKRFILAFEDGVIVIKHWKLHNTIQGDRYTPTVYQDELKSLGIKKNKAYTLNGNNLETKCIQIGNNLETNCKQNVSTDIDKDIDKDIDIVLEKDKGFIKPTLEELEKYINENKLNVNAPYFYNYYESNGWKVGPNQMEDWKAKLKQWSLKEKTNKRELPTYHVMEDDNEGKEEIINSLKERWKE